MLRAANVLIKIWFSNVNILISTIARSCDSASIIITS